MRFLTIDQLLLELDRRAGLIPTAFDIGGRKLVWTDLETYHPYEGFFNRAVDRFAALKQSRHPQASATEFVTSPSVLSDHRILKDSICPSGFIYHAGRCGSTLLARVLARDRRHLVIGEAAAHNQVWRALTNDGEAALTANERTTRIYKHLVLAMGRKRLPGYEAHFVKFTSFNILFFDFIRQVFPDVPAIFLYREPFEILASYAKSPPSWFGSNQGALWRLLTGAMSEGGGGMGALDPATAVAGFFTAGLRAGKCGAKYLNYSELKPGNLPLILKTLNTACTLHQLTTMQSQFRFDSKVDHRASEFLGKAEPQGTPSSAGVPNSVLRALYNQLVESDLNLASPRIADPEDAAEEPA